MTTDSTRIDENDAKNAPLFTHSIQSIPHSRTTHHVRNRTHRSREHRIHDCRFARIARREARRATARDDDAFAFERGRADDADATTHRVSKHRAYGPTTTPDRRVVGVVEWKHRRNVVSDGGGVGADALGGERRGVVRVG